MILKQINMYLISFTLGEAVKKQTNLPNNIFEFNRVELDQTPKQIKKERDTYESINALHEGRQLVINACKGETFSLKPTQGKGIKI